MTGDKFRLAYIVSGLAVLLMAWLPVELSVSRFLYEDFFYYLKIAANIIGGQGSTLDGVARTNGFHPLWMVICMGASAVASVSLVPHLVLTVAAALHVLQGYLIFRILSLDCGKWIAQAAAVFWLFNYRVAACNLCGLETPLAVALLLATVYVLRRKPVETGRDVLGAGALLGLSVLGRFDLFLAVPFVGLLILCDRRSELGLVARLVSAAATCVVALICMVPWFVWSYMYSGALLPNSRLALVVCGYHGLNLHQPLGSLLSTLGAKASPALYWLTDAANLFGVYPLILSAPPVSSVVSIVLLVLLFGLFAALFFQRTVGAVFYWVVFFWGLLQLGYYMIVAKPEIRYLLPSCAVTVLVAAVVAAGVMRQRPVLVRAFSVVFVILFLSAGRSSVAAWRQCQGSTRTHLLHGDLYETANSLRLMLPSDTVVGSWNAGILSYYSGVRVVNLDGVVNDDVIAANINRDMGRYLDKRGIQYLVDFNYEVNRFMDKFSGEAGWREKYKPVFQHRQGRVIVLKRAEQGAGR